MLVYCPTCRGQIETASLPAGATAACPLCRGLFQVPETATSSGSWQHGPAGNVPNPQQASAPEEEELPPSDPLLQHRVQRQRQASPWGELGWLAVQFLFWGGLLAAVGVVLFLVAQNRRQAAPPAAVIPPGAETSPGWKHLGYWVGTTSQETGLFTTTAANWRIRWQTTALPGEGRENFSVNVQNAAGRQVAAPVSISGTTKNTAYVQLPAGRYRLEVLAFNTQWEITVEEPLP